MIMSCNCLGCQNIEKRLKLARPCVPTESISGQSNREYESSQYGRDCIPKPIVDERYERNVNTSKLYQTKNIPERFERPYTLNGYGNQYKRFHPVFHTTNSEYGWLPPNVHTVPHQYYPRTNEFSELMAKSGPYRNYSLNTALDKSRV